MIPHPFACPRGPTTGSRPSRERTSHTAGLTGKTTSDQRRLIDTQEHSTGNSSEPLSGFLLQFALSEAFADAPYRAWPKVIPSRRQALQMIDGWQHVPLSPFLRSHCPAMFAVAPGLVAQLDLGEPGDDECTVSVVATDRSVLRPLRALDLDWSEYDG